MAWVQGTFEQEEMFDWAIIELIDPNVGSSVSIKLGLVDSKKQILENKEILGEEWNKRFTSIYFYFSGRYLCHGFC